MTTEEVTAKLQSLQDDPSMATVGKYSPTALEWPDGQLPFIEIHLAYLRAHKLVNPAHYLSNLELMIKKRS
jgi:hypothetical protein